MTVATRTEVGTCDLGNVFVFAQVNGGSPDSWMVRAGNHTVGTYDTEAKAKKVARALTGGTAVSEPAAEAPAEEPVADEPAPEPEPEVAAPAKKVAAKK